MNLSVELAFLIVMVDIRLAEDVRSRQNAENVFEKNFGQKEGKMQNEVGLNLTDAEAFVLQCRMYEDYPTYVGKADDSICPTYALLLQQRKLTTFKKVYSKFKNLAVGPWKPPFNTSKADIQVSVTINELRILKDVLTELRIRAIGIFKLQQIDKIYLDNVQSCFAKICGPAVETYISPFTGKAE